MTLKEWIEVEGVKKVSRLLDVDVSCVHLWRRGKRLPRPRQMQKIKKATEGLISYDEMIETYLRKNRR